MSLLIQEGCCLSQYAISLSLFFFTPIQLFPNFKKPPGNDITQSGHPQAEQPICFYGWSKSLLLSVSRLANTQEIKDVLVRRIPLPIYHDKACNQIFPPSLLPLSFVFFLPLCQTDISIHLLLRELYPDRLWPLYQTLPNYPCVCGTI